MSQDQGGEGLDVVRNDVVTTIHGSASATGPNQVEGRAWRRPQPNGLVTAGRSDNVQDVLMDVGCHVDSENSRDETPNRHGVGDRGDLVER